MTCTKCGAKLKWIDYQAFTGHHGTVWLDVFECPNHGQVIDTMDRVTRFTEGKRP